MAGWLHGVLVGEWLFVFPLCGFSLSLFCNYPWECGRSNWLHGVFVGGKLFVFPLCGFSLSVFCNYSDGQPSELDSSTTTLSTTAS